MFFILKHLSDSKLLKATDGDYCIVTFFFFFIYMHCCLLLKQLKSLNVCYEALKVKSPAVSFKHVLTCSLLF